MTQLVDAAHECGLMVFLEVVYDNFVPGYVPEFFNADVETAWGRASPTTSRPFDRS